MYDAEGARIAQGTLSSVPGTYATCAPLAASGSNLTSSAGFSLTKRFPVDIGGQQATEPDNTESWQHSNFFTGGKLVATYDRKGIHFELTDPLGTKRIKANIAGQIDETCTSLPFGNDLSNPLSAQCSAPLNGPQANDDATEHHFTQKERDDESGNDYFFARYYASALGRFTSLDWSAKVEPVQYAKLDNPQSLNLYAYVGNNPLARFDLDGHGPICVGFWCFVGAMPRAAQALFAQEQLYQLATMINDKAKKSQDPVVFNIQVIRSDNLSKIGPKRCGYPTS